MEFTVTIEKMTDTQSAYIQSVWEKAGMALNDEEKIEFNLLGKKLGTYLEDHNVKIEDMRAYLSDQLGNLVGEISDDFMRVVTLSVNQLLFEDFNRLRVGKYELGGLKLVVENLP